MSSDDRGGAGQGQPAPGRSAPAPSAEGRPAPGQDGSSADRGGGAAPAGQGQSPSSAPADDPLRGSRTSGVWIATAGVGILLVLLVIFIVQNTQQVDIAYFGWSGQLPMAAAILVAAAAGILITTLAGGLRIIQLRRRVKRGVKEQRSERKAAAKAAKKG